MDGHTLLLQPQVMVVLLLTIDGGRNDRVLNTHPPDECAVSYKDLLVSLSLRARINYVYIISQSLQRPLSCTLMLRL